MELIEYPDRDIMMFDLTDRIVSDLSTALTAQEMATFAVPGGTTPGPVFDTLSAADLHWERIRILLTDERWVPEDNPRSNTRLLRQRLLTDKAAAATYLPLYRTADRPEDVLDDLSDAIEPALPISVLLLGMGADLHTASLFTGADNLEKALSPAAPILMAMRGGGAPEPRVTLTAPVLKGAMSTHVLITGHDKRAALERAKDLRPDEAPIALVLNDAVVHWAA